MGLFIFWTIFCVIAISIDIIVFSNLLKSIFVPSLLVNTHYYNAMYREYSNIWGSGHFWYFLKKRQFQVTMLQDYRSRINNVTNVEKTAIIINWNIALQLTCSDQVIFPMFLSLHRRYIAEILPIRHKSLSNQSILSTGENCWCIKKRKPLKVYGMNSFANLLTDRLTQMNLSWNIVPVSLTQNNKYWTLSIFLIFNTNLFCAKIMATTLKSPQEYFNFL